MTIQFTSVRMLYLSGFDAISSMQLNPRMGFANTSEVTRNGMAKVVSNSQDSNLKGISTYPSKGILQSIAVFELILRESRRLEMG